jgi:UDP-glucose 4-epimerase
MEKILVTGGAGYIGSHTSLVLLKAGYDVVVLDNLCNSSSESLNRVKKIAQKAVSFVEGDVRDSVLLKKIFQEHRVDTVLHFAGLKSVRESVEKPIDYFSTNVAGTISLCDAMASAGIYSLLFSSSCTVYGNPLKVPIAEDQPTQEPTNPYGRSKLMVEKILADLAASNEKWRIAILRYFNPIGAHESGLIGENPRGIPNNLLPYITQVAVGRLKRLNIFGGDYPTIDGTGVRDYIHVMDLAEGHLAALRNLVSRPRLSLWNLGTGVGYSVLQVVRAFESVSGHSIPFEFVSRRPGDIAEAFADPTKARRELGWFTQRGLEDMVRDAWRWQSQNPAGFLSSII